MKGLCVVLTDFRKVFYKGACHVVVGKSFQTGIDLAKDQIEGLKIVPRDIRYLPALTRSAWPTMPCADISTKCCAAFWSGSILPPRKNFSSEWPRTSTGSVVARVRRVRDRRQAFSGDVVDHVQDPEPPTASELVTRKVQ